MLAAELVVDWSGVSTSSFIGLKEAKCSALTLSSLIRLASLSTSESSDELGLLTFFFFLPLVGEVATSSNVFSLESIVMLSFGSC